MTDSLRKDGVNNAMVNIAAIAPGVIFNVRGTVPEGGAPDTPIAIAGRNAGGVLGIPLLNANNILRVTPIAGQDGVQGAAGVLTALTQRITMATDDLMALALGLTNSVATEGDTDGNLIGKFRGYARIFGLLADAASPTGTAMARFRAMVNALEIIDDWDEADRCKVNPIAGQVGVQGAAGVLTALTQRITLATDDLLALAVGLTNSAATEGDTDGNLVGKVRGYARIFGLLADAASPTGTAMARFRAMTEALQIIDDWDDGADSCKVVGNVGHGIADAGNPVKIGSKAVSVLPAAVAANQRANLISDLYGRPMIASHVIATDSLQTTPLVLGPMVSSAAHTFLNAVTNTTTGTPFTTGDNYTSIALWSTITQDGTGYGSFVLSSSDDGITYYPVLTWSTVVTAGTFPVAYHFLASAPYWRVDFTRTAANVSAVTVKAKFYRG